MFGNNKNPCGAVQTSSHVAAGKLHEMVGQLAKATPDILALPEVARALEQELIHLMIRCLTEAASSGMTTGGRRHDAIVARLEEFLEAHPNTPLYLTEICAGIGVAERTLRVACEEHLGMGPIRYLNLRRMHLVRRGESPSATLHQPSDDRQIFFNRPSSLAESRFA